MSMSFDQLFAPLGQEKFLQDYHGKYPLHLEGESSKFLKVMNWDILNSLLSMTSIWSYYSLRLVLDKTPIAPQDYTFKAIGRDGVNVQRPDPAKVKAYLKQGATLVANDIDYLEPELNMLARSIEQTLHAKVQANLYLSSKRKQGFKVHFDYHDVLAIHVMGEKVWYVYEGRADNPIVHPAFENLPPEHHEKAKGKLWREVRLKPGDILYLPRGQYHYALAEDGPCAHIALGITYPIGMDILSILHERMIGESVARSNIPTDKEKRKEWLKNLGGAVQKILNDEQLAGDLQKLSDHFPYKRELIDVPELLESTDMRYVVTARDIKLVSQAGRFGLVKAGTRQAVEVPSQKAPVVDWVLQRQRFSKAELEQAFDSKTRKLTAEVVTDLQKMALISPE